MTQLRSWTQDEIRDLEKKERAVRVAHSEVRGLLGLGARREIERLQGGREGIVRSGLKILAEAGYVGPGRTVLEWACARAETGEGDELDWQVATNVAAAYLAHDIDPVPSGRWCGCIWWTKSSPIRPCATSPSGTT